MTLSEFRAWLEGYAESFENGHPDLAQWRKINEKLGTVDAFPKTPRVHEGILGQPNIGRIQMGNDLYGNRYNTVQNRTAVCDAMTGAKLGPSD